MQTAGRYLGQDGGKSAKSLPPLRWADEAVRQGLTLTTPTIIAEKVLVVIVCRCGIEYAVWQKPGDVVCLTCPKCGQTLTAIAPMRG